MSSQLTARRSSRAHLWMLRVLVLSPACWSDPRSDGGAACSAPPMRRCDNDSVTTLMDPSDQLDARIAQPCIEPCFPALDGAPVSCAAPQNCVDASVALDASVTALACSLKQEPVATALVHLPTLISTVRGFGSAWFDVDHARLDFASWDDASAKLSAPQRIDEGFANGLSAVWSKDLYTFVSARATSVLLQNIPSRSDGSLELAARQPTRELARSIRPQQVQLVPIPDGYAIVWQEVHGDQRTSLMLARAGQDGTLIATTPLSEPSVSSHSPRLLALPDGVVVVWTERRGELERVVFARVDARGVLSAPRELATVAASWASSELIAIDGGIALAIAQRTAPVPTTQLLHLTVSGELVSQPLSFRGLPAGRSARDGQAELLLYQSEAGRDLLEVDRALGTQATSAQLRIVRAGASAPLRESSVIGPIEVREFGRPMLAIADSVFVWADGTKLWLGRVSCF